MTSRIGFVGLGNMGVPMATNLARAGHHVVGFDVVPEARAAALARGVTVAADLAGATRDADTVITMLPAGVHVLAVWTELAALVAAGTLLIDSSTIDVEDARRAHALAAAHRCVTLDAPVSGGTAGAAAASLTFMVGGSPEAFASGQPILAAMGKRIVHCGEAGAGQAAKICNNMVLGISMTAVCEAFVLAERLGLSHQALFDVASVSSGQCWSLTSYCPVPGPVPTSPANHGYKPGFAAALMLKDLQLARQAARDSGAATPLGAAAAALYERFTALGHGSEDFSAIIQLLRDEMGWSRDDAA